MDAVSNDDDDLLDDDLRIRGELDGLISDDVLVSVDDEVDGGTTLANTEYRSHNYNHLVSCFVFI